ncbi:MAG: hypothetical protein HKL85_13285 [Acidimicrobiaceae bacterium]|nr:hypothetical protein [Acidimicrobiaceae bacterium]
MAALQEEFDYYVEHQAELVERYLNKFIVIRGQVVDGAFDSAVEAYKDALTKYEAGTFMIQHVTPGKESYSQTYFSNVAI